MPLSNEMRRLQAKWLTGTSWPQRLDWVEIDGIRGWTGQRVTFAFPIVALVGENGSGKSTILQAAAAAYAVTSGHERYASDFFPDTPFEKVSKASIRYSFKQGGKSQEASIRKPGPRWRGNPGRPRRDVENIDLRRIQPVGARVGYSKLLTPGASEGTHKAFDADKLARLSAVMGREYAGAGLSTTTADNKRFIPVLKAGGSRYSGFHTGAGELAAAELLAKDQPPYSLVLIDEVETSLHPRAQRKLLNDLAHLARTKEVQIILSTHSPYVLDELPPEGRVYIMDGASGKTIITGVSPDFAMTRMDDEPHPECDVYVEDKMSVIFVTEALVAANEREVLSRIKVLPYGSASVGHALGQMVSGKRFGRPTVVFLDGDQDKSVGCNLLPGEDAPERVVFGALKQIAWIGVHDKIGRSASETIDALNKSITIADHHEWVRSAADSLVVGTEVLWQAMCGAWTTHCTKSAILDSIALPIKDALGA
ncbi:MAG TPA: AAA family ATPase [Candidatus Dormibacteraeota bacterium]|nr:AAA family ATPase [Candidatus Dormibacteraeota bacterium]